MSLELTAVTGALSALKALTGIAKDVNNIEFNQKIIELQQKLLDIQVEYGNLVDENRSLKTEIEAAKALDFHHSVYWKKAADTGEEGPFCPICYGDKTRLMPLEFRGPHSNEPDMLLFVCPIQHVPKGQGRNTSYRVPKNLVLQERYAKWG